MWFKYSSLRAPLQETEPHRRNSANADHTFQPLPRTHIHTTHRTTHTHTHNHAPSAPTTHNTYSTHKHTFPPSPPVHTHTHKHTSTQAHTHALTHELCTLGHTPHNAHRRNRRLAWSLPHSFVCLCVCSFAHSLIRWLTHSFSLPLLEHHPAHTRMMTQEWSESIGWVKLGQTVE